MHRKVSGLFVFWFQLLVCPAGGTGIRAGLRNRLLRVRISGGAPRILQYRTGHRARSNAVSSLTNWMWLFVTTSLSFPGGARGRVLTRGHAKPAGEGGRHDELLDFWRGRETFNLDRRVRSPCSSPMAGVADWSGNGLPNRVPKGRKGFDSLGPLQEFSTEGNPGVDWARS